MMFSLYLSKYVFLILFILFTNSTFFAAIISCGLALKSICSTVFPLSTKKTLISSPRVVILYEFEVITLSKVSYTIAYTSYEVLGKSPLNSCSNLIFEVPPTGLASCIILVTCSPFFFFTYHTTFPIPLCVSLADIANFALFFVILTSEIFDVISGFVLSINPTSILWLVIFPLLSLTQI